MIVVLAALLLAQSTALLATRIYFPDDDALQHAPDALLDNPPPATEPNLTSTPPLQSEDGMELDQSQNESASPCEQGLVNLDDDCYEPFTRGPCDEHHYVYQSLNETFATCVKNLCKEPDTFPYQNRGCFKLNVRSEACLVENQVLLVDVATHQLKCTVNGLSNRMPVIIDAPNRPCRNGRRRDPRSGICRRKV